jgi:hypothetical protein
MPVYFSDFAAKIHHLRVAWEDVEVDISYDPSKNSAGSAIDMQEQMRDGQFPVSALVDWLERVLVGWDIVQSPPDNGRTPENGEEPPMLPITRANLERLPLPFLNAIMTQISERQSPPARKSGR